MLHAAFSSLPAAVEAVGWQLPREQDITTEKSSKARGGPVTAAGRESPGLLNPEPRGGRC